VADQVDFPDIYLDESVAPGGVGSEADPYSDFSEINWSTGGDNSIFDYYAGSPAASVTLNLQKGEEWREQLTIGHAGTVTYPLKTQAYGAGNNPIINGSDLVATWSDEGSNVWSAALTTEPKQVFVDGTRWTKVDALGSVDAASEWWWESDTLYIYATADPDTEYTTPGVEATIRNYCIYAAAKNYVTIDGVDCHKSKSLNIYFAGSTNGVVKNLTSAYHTHAAVKLSQGSHDCLLSALTLNYGIGDGIGVSGVEGSAVERLTITGCTIHDNDFIVGISNDAAGIKAFNLNNSTITKSTWYNNDSGGIRLDGGFGTPVWGCDNNEISENKLYGNGGNKDGTPGVQPQIMLEFSTYNDVKFNLVYDGWGGGTNIELNHTGTDNNVVQYNVTFGATGTSQSSIANIIGAGDGGSNMIIGNVVYNSYWGIEISADHGLILKNNAVHGSTNTDLRVGTGYADINSDYNCFSSSATTIKEQTTGYTLAQWKTYTSGLGKELDTNSLEADPLFTNAGADDFTLTSDSPCIDAGFDLGDSYKWALDVSSTWPDGVVTVDQDLKGDGWEIGAYASPAGAGTSNTTLILLGR